MATKEYTFIVKFSPTNVGGAGPLLEGGVDAPDSTHFLQKVSAMFAGIAAGNLPARVLFAPSDVGTGTPGTGTVTCTQATAADGDTVVIGGRTFTARTSGANRLNGEFNIGATDAECAANLAATVALNPYVTSVAAVSVATNVVTLTSLFDTTQDFITLAETGVGFVLSGARVGPGTDNTQTDTVRGYGGA